MENNLLELYMCILLLLNGMVYNNLCIDKVIHTQSKLHTTINNVSFRMYTIIIYFVNKLEIHIRNLCIVNIHFLNVYIIE